MYRSTLLQMASRYGNIKAAKSPATFGPKEGAIDHHPSRLGSGFIATLDLATMRGDTVPQLWKNIQMWHTVDHMSSTIRHSQPLATRAL